MSVIQKINVYTPLLINKIKDTYQNILADFQPFTEIKVNNAPEWSKSFSDPYNFYLSCHRFFKNGLPKSLKDHRTYFSQNGRGFGNDAHHSMWYFLFQHFKFKNFLEIGVYRGQVASLMALLQKNAGMPQDVYGISPFEPVGDSVSDYMTQLDYEKDVLTNFKHFGLDKPTLLKAYSTDEVAQHLLQSKKWDCVYIDGNHDYPIAKADWELCSANMAMRGLVVMDDASLYCNDHLPGIVKFRGHPGPSKLVDEIDKNKFKEIVRLAHIRVYEKIS